MNIELSKDFKHFHNHVFGDGQYFYYNGLPGAICTNLKGLDREMAEDLVLKALSNSTKDERPIIAAGHLMLQSAIPLLEKFLYIDNGEVHNNVEAIVWALVKIKNDKKLLESLVDIVMKKSSVIKGLARKDATDLLSEFGENATAVNALLIALTDEEISVRQSARFALEKIFIDNVLVLELLDLVKFLNSSHDERMEISKKIKEILNN